MMEEWLLNLILGVTTNAAYDLGKAGVALGARQVKKVFQRESKAQPLLRQALESVAKLIPRLSPDARRKVQKALRTPEVEVIVKQVYATHIHGNKSILDTAADAFVAYVDRQAGPGVESFSRALWDVLVETCNSLMVEALGEGAFGTVDRLASLRHNVLCQDLTAIKDRLDGLVTIEKPATDRYVEFEVLFRQQVRGRHSLLMPARLSEGRRRLPIDDIYVPPVFRRGANSVSYESMLQGAWRVVILGQPGGGKSTLVDKICYDLSSKYDKRLAVNRELTPVVVVLREYAESKRKHDCSIVQFIETMVRTNYQISSPPAGAVSYLLDYGRMLVMFDGMDELVQTGDRQEIRDDIESFCQRYPDVPVIVTSREVGYEQAPVNKEFAVLKLGKFGYEQIQDYVTKWFGSDEELSSQEKQARAYTFLRDSEAIRDLQSNPLMLALLCNIYRYEGYIPENRPEIYRKCTEMLFERWDKSRQIFVQFSFEKDVSPAVMYLAHWIASDQARQNGVSETTLINRTRDYLLQRRFSDRDDAEQTAREFVEFCCKGRAWVLCDTGTEAAGESLYQFTHRTFLEYFAAAYLVRTHHSGPGLVKELAPWIARREWDMIAQLAFQMLGDATEDGTDHLLDELLRLAEEQPENRGEYLSFIYRSLAFLVPSQPLVEKLTRLGLEESMATLATGSSRFMDLSLLDGLLRSARQNRMFIARILREHLVQEISSADSNRALLALEMTYELSSCLDYMDENGISSDPVLGPIWDKESRGILLSCPERVLSLSSFSLYACWVAVNLELRSLREMTEIHGISSLFRDYPNKFEEGHSRLPLARSLLVATFLPYRWLKRHATDETLFNDLAEVGQLVMENPLPQIEPGEDCFRPFEEEARGEGLTLPVDSLFGLFCLLAAWSESSDDNNVHLPPEWWKHDFRQEYLLKIVGERFRPEGGKIALTAALDACEFNSKQRQFIECWVQGETSLIKYLDTF